MKDKIFSNTQQLPSIAMNDGVKYGVDLNHRCHEIFLGLLEKDRLQNSPLQEK